jgi:hypothetical protein
MEFNISTLVAPVASAVFTLTGNFSNLIAPNSFDVFGLTGNGLAFCLYRKRTLAFTERARR